jgi:SOS response regulatory protein OraA/RecX
MNKRIYNYSIHLLAKQDYSEFKLRQKLRSKKDNLPHEVDEVIQELKNKQLLREDNYRRLFIRKWMIKGESKDKIKLRGASEKLHFDEQEFQNLSNELGISDRDNLTKLLEKKLRFSTIPKDFVEKQKMRDKILRYLISKGHDYSDAKSALEKFHLS